jgi:rubredoxin-NAD+ reductase
MRRVAPPRIAVVGSGLAGYGVLRELRRLSPAAELVLITHDDGHFYSKPALSTALAKDKTADGLITIPAARMAEQLKLDLRSGRALEAIDPAGRVLLTTGGPVFYDQAVLALGAHPIRLNIAGNAAHRVQSINHLDHYGAFRAGLRPGARVLIIGAGLVGCEFANDLSACGYRPMVVDVQNHPLAHLLPEAVGAALRGALAAAGTQWYLGRQVLQLDAEGSATRARLDDGTELVADMVLSAAGLRPHIQIAREAGLQTGRGITVDATGRTSDPHIYAVGDCAEYPTGLAAYVTPIMAASRAIAASILGNPTPIRFPTLSVQVKTTAFPIVLLPAPAGAEGRWVRVAADKFVFETPRAEVLGYVLTGSRCEERMELDRQIGAAGPAREAA